MFKESENRNEDINIDILVENKSNKIPKIVKKGIIIILTKVLITKYTNKQFLKR